MPGLGLVPWCGRAMDWGGSGDPILLLHGSAANGAEWVPVVDHLLGDFRCLALDFWGHGRTPADGEPAFATYLDEIDTVINHFGLPRDRLALVGSSFGGAVAVCYEAQRPGCKAIVGDDSMPSAGLLLLCATKGMASNDRPFVDAMPQRFPMVKVTWIDGEHGLNRQFPDLVAQHIGDFLSAVR